MSRKPEGKRLTARQSHRCEDNIKMGFKETGCDSSGSGQEQVADSCKSGEVLPGIYWLTIVSAQRKLRIKGEWW
jgi:hypothetical protein